MLRPLLRKTVPLLTGPCRTAGVSTLSRPTVSSETSICPEFISFENSPSFLGPEKIALGSLGGAGRGEAWVGWGEGEAKCPAWNYYTDSLTQPRQLLSTPGNMTQEWGDIIYAFRKSTKFMISGVKLPWIIETSPPPGTWPEFEIYRVKFTIIYLTEMHGLRSH